MAGPGRGILARLRSWFSGPPGPINWTRNGGIPTGWAWNFWQQNLAPFQGGESATVNACVNAYAQTVAQLPGGHYRELESGGQERIKTSALSRILRSPNDYQTRSDFMLNMVSELLFRGNAYAWAERNDRSEVSALHLIPAAGTQALIEEESRAVFYVLSENPHAGRLDYAIPARDVMHVRVRTRPGYPLEGITPLTWAAMAQATNTAISASQAAFFAQASQPSGFLSTDQPLTGAQMGELREAWVNRAQGVAAGQVPVLGGGLKFQQLTMTSQDAQLVEAFDMSVADIARAYGVPLPIIGDLSSATFNNTEQLIGFWLSTGLGFLLEHIELAFDKFFGLGLGEFTEFETDSLLRTDFKNRIDGLTKAITGGLYSPNEARRREGLEAAKDGDEPRVQAQVVPLSAANAEPATSAPAANTPDAPAGDPANDNTDEEEAAAEEKRLAFEARIIEAVSAHLAADLAERTAQSAQFRQLLSDLETRNAEAAETYRETERGYFAERLSETREQIFAALEARADVDEAEAHNRAAEREQLAALLTDHRERTEAGVGAVVARTAEEMAEQFETLASEVTGLAHGQAELRMMIEAAEPALDPEEAEELMLLQIRKAKREANNAP